MFSISFFLFFFLAIWNMSRLLRLNSPTAIWWQFSVRAQEQSACDTVGIHTYMGVSYLPLLSFTSWMIRGLRVTIPVPRGRKSLLQRKKRIWRRIHTHARRHTNRRTTSLYCQANLHLWSGACTHYGSAQPFKSVQSTKSQWVSRISSQKISEFS